MMARETAVAQPAFPQATNVLFTATFYPFIPLKPSLECDCCYSGKRFA